MASPPCALVSLLSSQLTSLTKQAGHPCQRSLASYQDDNILNDFIIPVENSMRIIQIPLVDIISKVVYVTTSRGSYVVKQPNCLEHN